MAGRFTYATTFEPTDGGASAEVQIHFRYTPAQPPRFDQREGVGNPGGPAEVEFLSAEVLVARGTWAPAFQAAAEWAEALVTAVPERFIEHAEDERHVE